MAVSAAAAAVLGGVPAAVIAASAGGASATNSPTFGPLSPTLAAQLSQNVNQPVIVVLKNQFGAASAGTPAAGVRSAAVAASQTSLLSQLNQVHATGVKQFALVNAVSATVSAGEAQRLAASPAVAQVIPDATVTLPASALGLGPSAAGRAAPAGPDRTTSKPLNNVAGACAPKGRSYLAPEGLALTGTQSQSSRQPTARSLGFTGSGVKVAWIADGIDPSNVNFIRKNGKSAFVDYQDFSGDGKGTPTAGGEAFLDANTIAGQGLHVYNLSGFSQQNYKNGCYIRIEGVAPGASLVGIDIFAGEQNHLYATTNSLIAEAINYAVERDHVNVINESFGGNPFPDTTQDVIKLFDNAATKAGVVVAASSGDSGTTSTIGSPATDPSVISAGATTQFQMYEQSNYGLARYFSTGWLSDNISGLSSSGYNEAGATIDVVAPGDLSWASCDANTAKFAECTNLRGKASNIEISGGTSESSPFVAGAAALVIQAYRKTHGGRTPSPALVKQIIASTATDLNIPAQEQGAGLLNTYKAVQLAESIDRSGRTGSTLLESTTQLDDQGMPGSTKSWAVTLTNTGSKRQTVSVHGRALGANQNVQSGTVTLNDATSNQALDFADFPDDYATWHIHVPAGQSRLDVSIAYPGNTSSLLAPVTLTLIDPRGRYAANSDPQGFGNYGNVDVRTPAAGTWTAIVNDITKSTGGYNGTVSWQAETQRYHSFGSVSSSSFSLAPGASKKITYTAAAPTAPGDYAASLAIDSNPGGATSIPVVVRSLVNVAACGTFSGVLTGGNGRPGGYSQDNYYAFNVPAGTKAISAAMALTTNAPGATGGVIVGAYLVSPDGNVVGSAQNYDISSASKGVSLPSLDATVLSPDKGRWTLVAAFAGPIPGTEVADPFNGTVKFATAGAEKAAALPDSTATDLGAGATDTIPVTITNTGSAAEDYYLDPRLSSSTTLTLAPVTDALAAGTSTLKLPGLASATFPTWWVPSNSRSISVRQTSTIGATTDLQPVIGDPDTPAASLRSSSLCGRSVSVSYTAPGGDLTPGLWNAGPTECGPFTGAAKSGRATDKATVATRAFDKTMTPSTGDLQQLATLGASASTNVVKHIVELAPGASVTVNVVIKVPGKVGTVVRGTLYLDDVATGLPPAGLTSSSQVAALSYAYTVVLPV